METMSSDHTVPVDPSQGEPGAPPPPAAMPFTRAGALWSALIAGFLVLIVLLVFVTQNTDPPGGNVVTAIAVFVARSSQVFSTFVGRLGVCRAYKYWPVCTSVLWSLQPLMVPQTRVTLECHRRHVPRHEKAVMIRPNAYGTGT